ncbi:MAG: hypothetical protein K6A23_08005, partial [Butyrivibrio sp.]|nr:hypothetical protein [Butyrivibrio sp.]
MSKDNSENDNEDILADSSNESVSLDNNQSEKTTPRYDNVEIPKEIISSEATVITDTFEGDVFEAADAGCADFIDIPENMPTYYISDDVNGKDCLTEVKNQGQTSMCWAYAAIGALESDLLMHHDNLNASDLDFSEKHLAYYNLHKTEGSLDNLIDEDYRYLKDDSDSYDWIFDYDTGYLSVGGVSDYCIDYFTSW